MSRCLVTGAAGFLGSHVARHLLIAGHDVLAVDDLSGGLIGNVPEGAQFVRADICDQPVVAHLFEHERIEFVFHLAAYAAEGLSHFIRRYNYTNNLLGSVNLINESIKHDVKRFVFTSSIAVYGAGQVPMREDQTPQPEDPYGIAKYAVELDLAAAHEMFGLAYTIFRPHNVYGEHQNLADRYRNVVGIFMRQVMAGEPMTIFGDGSQTRAFSHVDDVAPIIARSIDVPECAGETFNIGASRPTTVLDLAVIIAEQFGVEPKIDSLPARHEVLHAFADHEKVRSVFGGGLPVQLEDGIAAMAAWAMEQGIGEPSAFGAIEVDRNLPEAWR